MQLGMEKVVVVAYVWPEEPTLALARPPETLQTAPAELKQRELKMSSRKTCY